MLKIAETAIAEIIVAEHLQTFPGFMLDGLKLYCGLDQDNTVGSSPSLWSSSDVFRFDKNTMKLTLVATSIPEVLPKPEEFATFSRWQEVPYQEGLLCLVEWAGFDVEIADIRYMDEEGKALMCPLQRAFEEAEERIRVRIAPDLELWFADGEYCGWALLNPAQYLIENPGDELTLEPKPIDPQIITLLYEYLQTVTKSNAVVMDDGDSVLRDKLLALYERTRVVQGSSRQRRVLLLAIADILDRFYEIEVHE